MKLKLSTDSLKLATAKASKGAGNLSMLTITSAISLELIKGDLVLETTTNSHNLEVKIKGVAKPEDSFYACTDCELFTKLVSKTSVDNITLELTENALVFDGDGLYNLPLLQDEEGNMVHITPITVDSMESISVSAEELKKLLTWNKLAVAKTLEEPIFTGYCVKNNQVFTYNNNTACVSNLKLDKINMLVPSSIVDLFNLFEDKNVSVSTTSNKVKFESSDIVITGALLEGFDSYPTEQLSTLVNSDDFSNNIRVSKSKFSNMVDRMSLFVSEDKNELTISFAKDKLIVSDKSLSAGEQLPYLSKNDVNVFEIKVDLNDVKNIVNEVNGDELGILYGSEVGLCVYSDNSRYIIPLLGDDESEEDDLK